MIFKDSTLQLFLGLALSLCMLSCQDSDEPEPTPKKETFDYSDANAISASLDIPGGVTSQGNPPPPSTDPEAPVLGEGFNYYWLDDAFFAPVGFPANIELDLNGGKDIAGVYFKIQGADEYYTIPVTEANERRSTQRKSFRHHRLGKNSTEEQTAQKTDYEPIQINIPESFSTGEFCANYCVFDAEQRVSNVIEVCFSVNELGGGPEADFLIQHPWELVVESEYWDLNRPEKTRYLHDSVGIGFYEYDTVEYQDCTLILDDHYLTNYFYIDFYKGGTGYGESDWINKFAIETQSNCEDGVQYKYEPGYSEGDFMWSYNSEIDRLYWFDPKNPNGSYSAYQVTLKNGLLHFEFYYYRDDDPDYLGKEEAYLKEKGS